MHSLLDLVGLVFGQNHESCLPLEAHLSPNSASHFPAPLIPHPLDKLLEHRPLHHTYYPLQHLRPAADHHIPVPCPTVGESFLNCSHFYSAARSCTCSVPVLYNEVSYSAFRRC